MGRPSKLNENQWAEIGRRLLDGEKAAVLARQYKVSKQSISVRFSGRSEIVKDVANQIIATENKFSMLTIPEQTSAIELASTLRSISSHLGRAANYGAMTSHRLAGIANAQVEKIDDNDPIADAQSLETLKGISALTRLSNDSAEIGLNLLKANKEAIDEANRKEDRKQPVLMTRVIGAN